MRSSTASLLIVLAIAVGVLWFVNTHHQAEVERYVGYSGEARRNDYLAAERLLQSFGFETESRATIAPTEWMPKTEDTLVLPLSASLASGPAARRLLDWVADGGALLVLAGDAADASNEFLEGLGYAVELPRIDHDDDEGEDEETLHSTYATEGSYYVKTLQVVDDSVDHALVYSANEIIAARREWGSGIVVVVANQHYFKNDYLDTGEHALMFLDLIDGPYDAGKVWFVYSAVFPSLWQVIWSAAPLLILGLALLFLFWLWSAIPIFGPRREPVIGVRRSIIEHISAAGIFVWRNHGQQSLVDSSTAALLHEAEARHPGIGRQAREQQAKSIAKLTGMSAQKVMDVLAGPAETKQREFTDSMRKLQSIRKEL